MIAKEKMFIVANNIDDSIKSSTPIYDITIFPHFLAFEEFINTTPIVLGSIVISARELPFTNVNMSKLLELLAAPFLRLTGQCIYLVDMNTPKDVVSSFLEDNQITTVICYQGDLSSRFITDIVSGAARLSDETETEVITYRMRASDYALEQNIKRYESDEDGYVTDEEELAVVPPIEEPEVQVPSVDILTSVYYVVGKKSIERTLFAFIEAQYLSLTGKTIIVESDVSYHRLTDMVLKSSVNFEYIDIEDFHCNSSQTVAEIKNSQAALIVIGCKSRFVYDYNFIFDLLVSNLTGWCDYFVKECDYSQTPYGQRYSIVCADTVPDILECCNSLAYDVDPSLVTMIGVRTSGRTDLNCSSSEMTDICRVILDKPELNAEVVEALGINLKGDEVVYDVLSVIGRGNERQG